MRSIAACLTLAFTFVAASAHAQEAVNIPPPPPPPVAVLQPPPQWVAPGYAKDLEHRGHTKKVAGALLMGLGSAAVVTGIVLNVLDQRCDNNRCYSDRGQLYAPSIALGLVGGAAILAGIPTYVVGGFEVAKGRRLELTGFGAAPTIGANGVSGVAANASFRF